jgi:aerobic carbon-monoxide dehydrogenase small subunit
MAEQQFQLSVAVNGTHYDRSIPSRTLLVDFLRDDLGLTGAHVACEEGRCGACTVEVNGEIVKSCLMFAVQADGGSVLSAESLGGDEATLSSMQQAFTEEHGLQCGFCTPGMLMCARDLLSKNPAPTDGEIRTGMVGNLCRCTGYQGIVASVRRAAELIEEG